jgi:hypothetical protein
MGVDVRAVASSGTGVSAVSQDVEGSQTRLRVLRGEEMFAERHSNTSFFIVKLKFNLVSGNPRLLRIILRISSPTLRPTVLFLSFVFVKLRPAVRPASEI